MAAKICKVGAAARFLYGKYLIGGRTTMRSTHSNRAETSSGVVGARRHPRVLRPHPTVAMEFGARWPA